MGFEVAAANGSSRTVATAKDRLRDAGVRSVPVIRVAESQIPPAGYRYGCVVCVGVLEYVDDDRGLESLTPALENGESLVITLPKAASICRRIEGLIASHPFQEMTVRIKLEDVER